MGARRFALIGHSGTGKSSCLLALGIDRKSADMDAVLGTTQSPPLGTALGWLAGDGPTPSIVVVSNHEQMLLEMRQAKLARQHPDQFSAVCFVYLRKPKDQLREHLALKSAGGRSREPAGQQYTLDNYERFDRLFADLADRTVDCTGRSVPEVAAEIRELAEQSKQRPAEPGAAAGGGA